MDIGQSVRGRTTKVLLQMSPGEMSTWTNVYQHICLSKQMSTRKKGLPGQMSTLTNVYPDKCLPG